MGCRHDDAIGNWNAAAVSEPSTATATVVVRETRVGSQIWINRTKDLIGRITAGPGSPTASLPGSAR